MNESEEIEEDADEEGTNNNGEEIWGELLRTATSNKSDDDAATTSTTTTMSATFLLNGTGDRRFIIGRDPQADIRIDDKHVSSKHCIVFRDEHRHVWVEDHSLSGTYVNGEKVAKNTRKRLENGDSLCLLRPCQPPLSTIHTPTGLKKKSPNKAKAAAPTTPYYEFVFRSHSAKSGPCKGLINEKYEVLDVIGSGSYATVRRGVNRRTGVEVAVKIVERKNFQFEPERWKDQLKEIDMLKRLHHPACVGLLDTYFSEEAIYIVMEFVKGGELFDRIVSKGKMSEEATRVLTKRLLQAVAYLHQEGIVHRDLKPENILLVHKEPSCFHIKVADFGVARIVGAGCKTLIGSMSYIAPEVLERRDTVQGVGTYDFACDLWSIGVIVYVCLMANLPFKSDQEDAEVVNDLKIAAKKLLEFKGEAWKGISDQAKDFLSGIFEIDTTKRFSAARALQHPWIANAKNEVKGEECGEEETEMIEHDEKKMDDHGDPLLINGDSNGSIEDHHHGEEDGGNRKRAKMTVPPVPLFSQ